MKYFFKLRERRKENKCERALREQNEKSCLLNKINGYEL